MSLTEIAEQTLRIVADRGYRTPEGHAIDLRAPIDAAIAGTRLYTPTDVAALLARVASEAPAETSSEPTRFEVTGETTVAACRRLAEEGARDMLALNFASAKNPGGGFLRGAKAQEEDVARCSALYTCQLETPEYYRANRADGSMLYTDHLIYSPGIPFFRDDALALLTEPFFAAVITSPAPNAGEALQRDAGAGSAIATALERRAAQVLAVAREHRHPVLVLGAWGCGVFKNDPVAVADVFAKLLASDPFRCAFERVVFAVYDRTPNQTNLGAFRGRFG